MDSLAQSPRHRFLIWALIAGPPGALAVQLAWQIGTGGPIRPAAGWTALVYALVLAPILEELVFRGGLQELLERTLFGRFEVLPGLENANILTSIAFALMHLVVVPGWLALATFLPSLVFGLLKRRYEPSLLPAMAVHFWYNLCYLTAACAWPMPL